MKADPSVDTLAFIKDVKRTSSNRVSSNSIQAFYDSYLYAADLQIISEKALTTPPEEVNFGEAAEERLKSLCRANCIVNWISAFEVFLKGIIVDYKELWTDSGQRVLLDKKISLNDALHFMEHTDMQKADLIAYNSSFQNIEAINKVFNTLLDGSNDKKQPDFLIRINFNYLVNTLIANAKDNKLMIKELIESFEKRHRIIHEGLYESLTQKDLIIVDMLMVSLPNQIDSYLDTLLNAKKKDKK